METFMFTTLDTDLQDSRVLEFKSPFIKLTSIIQA